MTWWQSILLGIVQGFTEFLPVSSSGHLVLAESLFGISEDAGNLMFYFVMLHFATALAVVVGLWRPIRSLFTKTNWKTLLLLVLATVPAGIVGLLLNDKVEAVFGSWHWLWIFFLITAVLLLVTEFVCKRSKRVSGLNNLVDEANPAPKIKWWQALIMGSAQAVAVLPGISRSGSTICSGMLAGGDKKSVADFSFIMSIPVILASAVLEMIKIESWSGIDWFQVALGMCAAFVCGLLAIKWMLAIIRKVNYKWFSVYLTLLSVVLIALQFAGVA